MPYPPSNNGEGHRLSLPDKILQLATPERTSTNLSPPDSHYLRLAVGSKVSLLFSFIVFKQDINLLYEIIHHLVIIRQYRNAAFILEFSYNSDPVLSLSLQYYTIERIAASMSIL